MLDILFNSLLENQENDIMGLKENLKNRHIYKSEILE